MVLRKSEGVKRQKCDRTEPQSVQTARLSPPRLSLQLSNIPVSPVHPEREEQSSSSFNPPIYTYLQLGLPLPIL